ncbi:hypothetical protein BH23GEM6_BH23GEM6_11700 [soil metagenome]
MALQRLHEDMVDSGGNLDPFVVHVSYRGRNSGLSVSRQFSQNGSGILSSSGSED